MKHAALSFLVHKATCDCRLAWAAPNYLPTGPSSSATPYVVSVNGGAEFYSVLTTGDAVKKKHKPSETYRMAGIPDGLGAFDNGDGTFTLLMNHEITPDLGIPRAHGGKGAFISQWQIRKSDLTVLNGEDLMQKVKLWNAATSTYVDTMGVGFSRFCSADLAKTSAFYNCKTGKGFSGGRIFMNGEEIAGGRALAHIASGSFHGTTYELPAFGHAAWENLLASPYEQDKTVVMGDDDTTPGNVYCYVGTKQEGGSPVQEAGLTNGIMRVIAVNGISAEDRTAGIAAGTHFSLVSPTDPHGTKFLRPEDGAWDTQSPNRYYFVTTDRLDLVKDGVGTTVARSRLWRLTFDNIENPTSGGIIEMMLNGTEAGQMYDNIAVDADGQLIILEDVGNSAHNGKVWKFDPVSHSLIMQGKHDPARFGDLTIPAGPGFNQDEETSGVIDVTDILANNNEHEHESDRDHGRDRDRDHDRDDDRSCSEAGKYKYFLLVVQAHFSLATTDPELVEKGQLLLLRTVK